MHVELDHVHAHGLDDAQTADGRAQAHDDGAQRHQPDGYFHRAHLRLTAGERHAEEEHADELLPVLRAVHEGHGRRAADLRRAEALVGAPALGVAEE